MENPFRYDAPTPRGRLIDRRVELDRLQRAAATRIAVRLSAPRRFGKTSLLRAHCETLREAGHRAVVVDLSAVGDREAVLGRIAGAYAELGDTARSAVRGLLLRFGLSINVPGFGAQMAPAPSAGASIPDVALIELLDLPRRLYAEDQRLTVVCFDELQDLLGAGRGLDGLLRSVIQHHGDAAAYVYAGSAPSLMRELFSNRERPLYGQARPLELGPLPLDETLHDVAGLFRDGGVDPGDALVPLVALSEGHPQRMALLMHHLFECLDGDESPDAPAVVDLVVELALGEVRAALEATWAGMTVTDRHVLRLVARGVPPTGRAAAIETSSSASTLASALHRLVNEGQHVTKVGDGWSLVDPLLALWIRRATT
ncbi:MAG: hypothetical protein ITG02_09950 [Patulibacter sp.]|nr:hypothetical protein [Patulibacter sp.]